MNIIKTQVHTIIMLVGPSNSGKTTFAKQIIIPQLTTEFDDRINFKTNIQYISSDDIRQDILGSKYDKYDKIMQESSSQAFDVLFAKLKATTSYPINSEFIILDTTGLNENFRNDVICIAKENNYNVDLIIFDYKSIDDYKLQNKEEYLNNKVLLTQVKRLKTEVLPNIKKQNYKNITRIKNKNFDIYEIHWEYEKYINNFLPVQYEWVIVSDVHGCYDELISLIKKYKFIIEDDVVYDTCESKKIGFVFIGDIIDKSDINDIEKTIKFIYKAKEKLKDRIQLVTGNHEHFINQWLDSDSKINKYIEKDSQKKQNYYNTTFLFERNEEIKNMFIELFNTMIPWSKYIGVNKKSFIITHAPCEVKYLEKNDIKSTSKQNNCLNTKSEDFDKIDLFLKKEAVFNHPIHIFGHLNQQSIRSYKNKVCIDSGCVSGGELVGYTINGYGGKPLIHTIKGHIQSKVIEDDLCLKRPVLNSHSVMEKRTLMPGRIQSKTIKDGSCLKHPVLNSGSPMEKRTLMPGPGIHEKNDNILFNEIINKKDVDISKLEYHDRKRLNYIIKNNIEYISGTISPSPKTEINNKKEFESLESGLNYYKDKVEEVVLQPKYMGSRCQLYLNTDIKKCYATTRNGYVIKKDLTELYNEQLIVHSKLMNDMGVCEIIMDGELMPWGFLGDGLINSKFRVIDNGIKSEIDFLKNNMFDDEFKKMEEIYNDTNFSNDKNIINKKELREKYGHIYETFKNIQIEINRFHPTIVHQKAWEIYHDQLDIYGNNEIEVDYKPFRILKITKNKENSKSSSIKIKPSVGFNLVNNDGCHVVNFNNKNYLKEAQEWYSVLVNDKQMEGCVIKPNVIEITDWVAPFIKVRNPNYLAIIYGYDMNFPKKFESLFKQKNTNRKIKKSIIEYNLGEEMLNADDEENKKQIIANLIFENKKEFGIDPRL